MYSVSKKRVCLRCEKVFTPDSKFNFLCQPCQVAAKGMTDYLSEGQGKVKISG